jgi:photosystem II stability/assembly factor-like uncharacterized protein
VAAIAIVVALLTAALAGCGGAGRSDESAGGRSTTTHRPAPTPRRQRDTVHFSDIGLLGDGVAWARGPGLYRTTDAGRSWQTITPPALAGPSEPIHGRHALGGVYFLNRRQGWAASGVAELPSRWSIYRTGNGGATWKRARIIGDPVAPGVDSIAFSFVDPRHGYAELEPIALGVITSAELYATDDGGRTWRPHGRTAVSGEFEFTSRRRGWVVSSKLAGEFFTTGDGGRHWSRVRVPLPAWANRQRIGYGIPIELAHRLVLAVILEDHRERSHVALYVGSPSGWKLAYLRKLKGLIGGGSGGSVSAVPPDGVVIRDPGAHRLTLVEFDAGRVTTRALATRGLNRGSVQFFDRRHGVALSCVECGGREEPYWTDNGGERWVGRPARPRGRLLPIPQRCDPAKLVVSHEGLGGGAMSTYYTRFTITNLAYRRCSLAGYPRIVTVGDGGRAIGPPAKATETLPPSHRSPAKVAKLAPRGTAEFSVSWSENAYSPGVCRQRIVAGYRVTLPGAHRAQFVPFPTERCTGAPSAGFEVGKIE